MSSRSLAAARSRRAGENAPPVSGNRPITSIGSQAAFAQQMPPNMGYNMPPPPNNVRISRSSQQQMGKPNQYKNQYQEQQTNHNSLPFSKLSISDAIGLITLRLGRVEQWIIETDNDNSGSNDLSGVPENHKIIDNSVLTSIINRLNSIEKNSNNVSQTEETNKLTEETNKLTEEINLLNEQMKKMGDVVSKHTIELAKCTEQVFKFNRDITETKDILKSFMLKYDGFVSETMQNFADYENALADLEKRVFPEQEEENQEEENLNQEEENLNQEGNLVNDDKNVKENESITITADLKNIIKQELTKI
jgi:cell division protein FtsB